MRWKDWTRVREAQRAATAALGHVASVRAALDVPGPATAEQVELQALALRAEAALKELEGRAASLGDDLVKQGMAFYRARGQGAEGGRG